MLRTQSQEDRISVALRKLLQRGRRGCQAIYKFASKGAGSLNIKDQVSSQGIYHSMYGKLQASGLTESIPFICISVLFLSHLNELFLYALSHLLLRFVSNNKLCTCIYSFCLHDKCIFHWRQRFSLASSPCWPGGQDSWFSSRLPRFNSWAGN